MARRKTEPCEYCEGDYISLESEEAGNELTLDLYPGHLISATAILYNPRTEESYEASVCINMNYCPVCGRKVAFD